MRSVRVPDRSEITEDTPLRLAEAVSIEWPTGGMTVAALRRERDAGRLVTERYAGKEWVTLGEIKRMRAACRDLRKAPVSTSSRPAETPPVEPPAPRAGSSVTAPGCTPQDALKAKLQALIKPSPTTSARRTGRRGSNVVSMPSR
jgi:hypothetical protein